MHFITMNKASLQRGCSDLIPLNGMTRWLALSNCNVYWAVPHTGTETAGIPASTLYLLCEMADGSYLVMLPMISGDMKATLRGADSGVIVDVQGALPGTEPKDAAMLCIAEGNNPYTLSHDAVAAVQKHLKSFRLREDKRTPPFMDYLGWCTWDAFYGSVDASKVIMGLDSFRAADFPLGFMLLDDGTWDAYWDYLNDTRSHPDKFPEGVGTLIRKAKEEYGLKLFGVWHCFEGYWGGIKPDGEAAKRYKLVHNRANIRPWEEVPKEQDVHLIHPEEAHRFYNELHTYLFEQGADMLKIDGQCAMDLMTKGALGQGNAMKAYQQAMQNSASRLFDAQVIHCMCHSNDVAYNMMATNCWRSSYDYAPTNVRMQQEHLYINGMMALWSSQFCIPDWDMFQSHSAGAEIHAAARAISGGPVYVCDYPGKQNFGILRRLITSDGKVLRCDQPALPTMDGLFTDYRTERRLFKLFNRCGKAGILGLFHCCEGEKHIVDTFCAADIPDLVGERFAVHLQPSGEVRVVSRTEKIIADLSPEEYLLATFVSIEDGVAPIGLTDKYNPAAAVRRCERIGDAVRLAIADGGEITVWCEQKPCTVTCNGILIDFAYIGQVLRVNIPQYGKVTLDIRL